MPLRTISSLWNLPSILDLFKRVQNQFASKNKPKYQKHDHAFSGLLVCANDGHQFTTETQKGRYTYYRCSDYGRDRCRVPYVREEKLSDELRQTLQDIYVPEDVCREIADSFKQDEANAQREREERVYAMQSRLEQLRNRIDKMYEDKLDGKIDDDFWNRKSSEWRLQEREIENEIAKVQSGLTETQRPDVQRVLELANHASFL